ncbi:hypothetical protein ACFVX9_37210 [Kitasatospora sp. NPDC058243]|uniref:hypothetical protein n=1 Tax=Kitasatospora sp. NPDC058243 TaxID=3346397 RepID=UPI0036DB55AA
MADIFPDTGQLRLADQATSGLLPLVVDKVATSWSVLVVALGPNCAPLGARPPDIELRAGSGALTTVAQAPATSSIVDGTGSAVGTASWTRDANDVFTVQIDISNPGERPWGLRITNTDPQELGFVWSTGKTPAKAQQPRIILDRTPLRMTVALGETVPDITIPISNIGTGPLHVNGPGDQPMGAGYVLKNFPASLPPNACDHLQIGISPVSEPIVTSLQTADFVLPCNDPVTQEVTLQLSRDEKGKDVKDVKDVAKENKDDKDDKERKEAKEDKDAFKEHPAEGMHPASEVNHPPEHFIPPAQRPDLADSALRDEPPEPGRTER